jgi:N-acyl-D-aspartate/D-glutamate deacylase
MEIGHFREAFREELRGPGLFHGAWNRVAVNAAKNPELQAVEGKNVEENRRRRGKDGLDTFFDPVLEDNLALPRFDGPHRGTYRIAG